MKRWIQSLSNQKLDPVELTVDMVGNLGEIAHSLAHNFRFTRQTSRPYSVAEHCVRGSYMLPTASHAAAFLLHELSEVYLPDIASPLKPHVTVNGQPWVELEKHHLRVILERIVGADRAPFYFDLVHSEPVKTADLRMLMTEKRDLLGPSPAPWGIDVEPYDVPPIQPWTPGEAHVKFLQRFYALRIDVP